MHESFTHFLVEYEGFSLCLQKHLRAMDAIDKYLQNVIESAIKTSSGIDPTKSLEQLYNERKEELQLSDRQIQKILGMDRNTLLPILDGTGKQVNFINLIKLAHFLKLSVNDLIKLY